MLPDATPLQVLLVGDPILDEPEPDRFFDAVRPLLAKGDVVVGHVEVPHTRRGVELAFDVPAPASDPEHLAALGRAGFHAISLAGNHIYDRGAEGVQDTIAALHAAGLQTCGAGLDLAAATRPALLERSGRRIGVLSYNCVGPVQAWAGRDKPGCAYVGLVAGSEAVTGPAAAADAALRIEPESLRALQRDVAALRAQVEVVIVSLHKGIVHTPWVLAGYERPLAHAAIDAGADIVFGHHAHITRGVEVYRGRPVFHGLGNFVTVTRALSLDNPHPQRRQWAQTRRERFGFSPDPDYPGYPFHPESKNAMIAACTLEPDGSVRAGFVPCWIEPSGRPVPLGRDARGQAVADYIQGITHAAGLSASLRWDGERVVFS